MARQAEALAQLEAQRERELTLMQARNDRVLKETLLHAHVHEMCRQGWLGCQEGVTGIAEKAQQLYAQVCAREREREIERESVCVCVCVFPAIFCHSNRSLLPVFSRNPPPLLVYYRLFLLVSLPLLTFSGHCNRRTK